MCWVYAIGGLILGMIITAIIVRLSSASGELLINQSDPKKDSYSFNLGDLDRVPKKRFMLIKIIVDNSQK